MALRITYFGHSGFLIDDGRHAIAVDPFLTGNPVATQKAEDVKCDFIAVSHGHDDHVGDTVQIAKANDATVYAAFELTEMLGEKGVKCDPGNPGGKIQTPFGFVAFTQAFHSSSYDGRYAGQPCGLIINIGGVSVYHAGDTALFSDMRLIGEIYRPSIAMLPIGDRFTMGPELASRAAELIRPRVAIPMHYRTWPPLVQSADKFKPAGIEVKVLDPGESWTFE